MSEATVALDPAEIAREIDPIELNRLLGMPRGRELEGDLLERAEWSRDWYARHGKPYLKIGRASCRERV